MNVAGRICGHTTHTRGGEGGGDEARGPADRNHTVGVHPLIQTTRAYCPWSMKAAERAQDCGATLF